MKELLSVNSAKHIKDLSSSEILELQKTLEAIGYEVGEVNGLYGNDLLYAFNKFKERLKLTNPGQIGPTTIKYLQLKLDESLDEDEDENSIHPEQPSFTKPQTVGTIDWLDYKCPISKYFTIGEVSKFTSSRIVYNEQHRKNVLELAKILDNIREDYGSAIGVTSWYRPSIVNKSVGGARNSQHLTGSGVDIYPIGKDGKSFENWLDKTYTRALGYGQRSNKGFTHVDSRTTPARIRWYY